MKLTATYGCPIPTIEYSQVTVGLEVDTDVDKIDGSIDELAQKFQERLVSLGEEKVIGILSDKRYKRIVAKLSENVDVKKLQVELAKEYEDKLETARKEYIKLTGLLKDNGISYK